jgi:hypothetical protein
VWARLARLEDIQIWSEAVVSARCTGKRSRGVGAERTCDLRGGITIREQWLAWDEGVSFAYEGRGVPLVSVARNEWRVDGVESQTLLTSTACVVLKGGALWRLLEPLVAFQSRRLGIRAMAAIKYLVEHDRPPNVRHAKLLPVPGIC